MGKLSISLIFIIHFLCIAKLAAQQTQVAAPVITYPRITGHAGIVHPLITLDRNGSQKNFDNRYIVGIAYGINFWKSASLGFSFEVIPFIKSESGISRVSNVLFHPGILTPLGKGFSFAGRAAFETSGRFGFTPILSKVIKKNKNSNFLVATPMPFRFGADLPSSFTFAVLFGIGF